MSRPWFGALLILSCLLGNLSAAQAASYAFTSLDAPGATQTFAMGINNRGQVVGEYFPNGGTYGFLYEKGSFTPFGPLGTVINAIGPAINDRGQIVGYYVGSQGRLHGFLYEEGVFTPLDPPEATSTLAFGINNRGQIVGYYFVSSETPGPPGPPGVSRTHGFLYEEGVFTSLDVPDAIRTEPIAINNRGQIVGRYSDSQGRTRGFLYDKHGFTLLDIPDTMYTVPYALNDRGHVVGIWHDGQMPRGFLYERGVFTSLDAPGATFTEPYAINNRGQIAGVAWEGSVPHGFVYENGVFMPLEPPGAIHTFALGMNQRGQVVGSYSDIHGTHGFLAESLLWYGGDATDGFFNNTRVTADFGSSVLDDFVVSDAAGWHITGLFSNNIADYPIGTAPFTQAVWSIRTGVGPGEPGDILFAGLSPVMVTPTGRTFGVDVEYTVAVSGLSIDLAPGVYFMNVSPVAESQIYYVAASDGTNAVGSVGPSGLLHEDRFIVDGNLQHIIGESGALRASMGVIGWVQHAKDSDGDGIPDNVDQCPKSDLSTIVTIDSCNSGVTNTLFPSGCTISDLIAACAEGASNHGQFVSCVSHLTNDLKQAGTITGQQKGAIQSCAAQADIP